MQSTIIFSPYQLAVDRDARTAGNAVEHFFFPNLCAEEVGVQTNFSSSSFCHSNVIWLDPQAERPQNTHRRTNYHLCLQNEAINHAFTPLARDGRTMRTEKCHRQHETNRTLHQHFWFLRVLGTHSFQQYHVTKSVMNPMQTFILLFHRLTY